MDIRTEKAGAPNRENRVLSRGGSIIEVVKLSFKAQLGGEGVV